MRLACAGFTAIIRDGQLIVLERVGLAQGLCIFLCLRTTAHVDNRAFNYLKLACLLRRISGLFVLFGIRAADLNDAVRLLQLDDLLILLITLFTLFFRLRRFLILLLVGIAFGLFAVA